MKMKTELDVLSKEEMMEIDGGHEGIIYQMGKLAAKNVKFVLGVLVGIREGLVSELDK